MAKEMSASELEQIKSQSSKALQDKQLEFSKQGKKFRYDPYGPGVVPDDIYDSLRDPKDPKYRKGENG